MSVLDSFSTSINEIKDMQPDALKRFAEEQSASILLEVETTLKEIDNFQSLTTTEVEIKGFENVKNFFSLGNTRRDKDLDALKKDFEDSRNKTGQILYKLIMLIQKSIQFTCSSLDFAQYMQTTMLVMLTNGICDSNGNIRQLDQNTQIFAQYIIDQTNTFVQNQKEYEDRVGKIETDIIEIKDVETDQDIRIGSNAQKLELQEQKYEEHDKRLDEGDKRDIEQDKALEEQKEKDREHDRRLNEGDKHDVEQDKALEEQREKDREHDRRLDEGDKHDAEQDKVLEEQKEKNREFDALLEKLSHKIEILQEKTDYLEKNIKSKNTLIFGSYLIGLISIVLTIVAIFLL